MFATIIDINTLSSMTFTNVICSLPDYYNIALAVLGLLLSFKYILSGSNRSDGFVEDSLNMGISPLIMSFIWVLIYNILGFL
jgi:hypothetical protein